MPKYGTVLHDKSHSFEGHNVTDRIAWHCNEVRCEANSEDPPLPLKTHYLRSVDGEHFERGSGRNPCLNKIVQE